MAGMLSAAEIASMQATQATAWPDVAIVGRPSLASDGMGGWTTTPTVAGTVVGRLMPMASIAAAENLGAAQPLSEERYWWTCAYTSDIRVQDTLTVNSQLLYVTEVNLDAGWETAKRGKATTRNQGVL